tara:strand:+ start:339 stop:878 length:540 start_codon:yes stop_codon:yes gene_type:complete
MKNNTSFASDPQLIKNPFVCNTAVGVRISLDKDPRDKLKNDTHFVNEYIGENGNHHLVSETNDKLSYCFGTAEEKEVSSFDNMDYQVSAETLNKGRKEPLHVDGLPLSFLQITTELDGIEWYKKNYPKLPDELLPIVARYHWGEPLNKKLLKKERKKIESKLQKKGFSIENKKVSLSFD